MRFSSTIAAVALMLTPWATTAQDAEQEVEAGEEAAAEAQPAAAAPPAFKHDKGCMEAVSPELEAYLGEPVAWPEEGQTVHRVAGLTVLDRPVSYVLAKRRAGRIDEIGYRLEGMQRRVGQPHDSRLLRDFDSEFDGASCARSTESSCGVIYEGKTTFSGAEIGSGEVDVARNARGPSLSLIKADYDMLDADPVFLVCFYRGGN